MPGTSTTPLRSPWTQLTTAPEEVRSSSHNRSWTSHAGGSRSVPTAAVTTSASPGSVDGSSRGAAPSPSVSGASSTVPPAWETAATRVPRRSTATERTPRSTRPITPPTGSREPGVPETSRPSRSPCSSESVWKPTGSSRSPTATGMRVSPFAVRTGRPSISRVKASTSGSWRRVQASWAKSRSVSAGENALASPVRLMAARPSVTGTERSTRSSEGSWLSRTPCRLRPGPRSSPETREEAKVGSSPTKTGSGTSTEPEGSGKKSATRR